MKNKVIYLPGLNGLRTIAALGVVISHTALEMVRFNLSPFLFGEKNGKPTGSLLGAYGVTIFFALSGFLITYLLLNEKKEKEINIRKFYLRRALRIWPLYYLYLFISVIVLLATNNFHFKGFIFYFALMANIPFIFNFALDFLHHYWSIGVEEQFYLFWPHLFKGKEKNWAPIVIFLIVLQYLIRVAVWYLYPGSPVAVFSLVNRFDCMMVGGLGAILYARKNKLFLKYIDNKLVQIFALAIIGLLIINRFHINAIVDNIIISFVTLIVIVGQINVRNRVISLDNNLFDFLGKISFGIYVYHPLVILFYSHFLGALANRWYSYCLVFGLVTITTILVAYLSYEYYERYFIKLKEKYSIVRSKGARNV